MEELQENEYTGRTVEEAKEEGLKALGITEDQAEITVIEEGKKKLFGSIKARVRVVKKATDSERATAFIDGLFKILKIPAISEVVGEGEKIEIEIKTANTASVIGRRGEVLDAIQCIAGAVANIGREEYRRVVVDCEGYRATREEKLKNLADSKAKKAVLKERRVILEPMSPYERRVIHSALAENPDVTTLSEGKEPMRRVVIIPNNEKPYEKKPYEKRPYKGRPYDKPYNNRRPYNKNYENKEDGGKAEGEDGEKREYNRGYNRSGYNKGYNRGYNRNGNYNRDRNGKDRNGEGYNRDRNSDGYNRRNSSSRPARGKKEIYFGTYLGNSGAGNTTTEPKTEEKDNKEE